MANVITDKDKLNAAMKATADAIRAKTGGNALIPWDYANNKGFADAIAAISGGGRAPYILPLTITENGIYNVTAGVDGYAPIIVNVISSSARCNQVVTFDWGEYQKHMAWMAGTPEPWPEPGPTPPPTPTNSSFTTGSDEEVAALIDSASRGELDLQRDAGWHIGDVRLIHLEDFNTDGTGHPAQNLHIVITSFDEYNNCGNLFQFDFVEGLANLDNVNYTDTTSGGYGGSNMYMLNLPSMALALPAWLKARLRRFSVFVSKGGSEIGTIETVADNLLALRSGAEIFGSGQGVIQGEGTQLPYYQSEETKIKKQGLTGLAAEWWQRTPRSSTNFGTVTSTGENSSAGAATNHTVAPFGCVGGTPSFSYGSDTEVAAMIDAASRGDLDLQRDAGWRVGDRRWIHLDAFTDSTGTQHPAQDELIVISSFAEYNSCGNVLQFDFKNIPLVAPINQEATTAGGYGGSEMCTTTLPALVQALPEWIRDRLTTFPVYTYSNGTQTRIDGNKLALRSLKEVSTIGNANEGVQVDYYKDQKNLLKTGLNPFDHRRTFMPWWLRTYRSDSPRFYVVNGSGGTGGTVLLTENCGVSPFGCLGNRTTPPGPEPPDPPTPTGSSFTTGTDEQVAALIDAAAAGTTDLQADEGWAVGDKRTVIVNGFTSGGVNQPAQTVTIAISSFAEYAGCGNVLQIDFASCLAATQKLNYENTTAGGYGGTQMYRETLPALVNALPAWLKTRLKRFDVVASMGYTLSAQSETVKGNSLALRSEDEVFGSRTYSACVEGTQVPYYAAETANRIKRLANSGNNATWWERSSHMGQVYAGCAVNESGSPTSSWPNNLRAVAPFGCLGAQDNRVFASWSTGTDEQVAALIDAALAGTVDLQNDAGWRIGDTRMISVSAHSSGGGVSQPAQDIPLVITSFAEYNNCENVLQFDFGCALSQLVRMSSGSGTGDGYDGSEMYLTTLPALVEALPSWLKTRLRTFSVQCNNGSTGEGDPPLIMVTGNKLALRSENEVFAERQNAREATEDLRMPYYVPSAAFRVKNQGANGSAAGWWLRNISSATRFCGVSSSGVQMVDAPDNTLGVAPFGCL